MSALVGLVTLTFDRLTLKLVCESHQRLRTFLSGFGHARPSASPMYATDGRTHKSGGITTLVPSSLHIMTKIGVIWYINVYNSCWCLESTVAGTERCALSACWDDFQTDIMDDVDSSPGSSRCFESVLSHPGEPDLDHKGQHHPPPHYDEAPVKDDPASFPIPYLGERSRLTAKDGHPGVRFQGGPDIRRQRSVDVVEDRRRKLCAALRYFQTTCLLLSVA